MLGHDLRDVVCWTLLEKIEVRRYIKGPFSSGIAPIAPYVTAKFSTIIVHTYLLRSERKSENKLGMPSTKSHVPFELLHVEQTSVYVFLCSFKRITIFVLDWFVYQHVTRYGYFSTSILPLFVYSPLCLEFLLWFVFIVIKLAS